MPRPKVHSENRLRATKACRQCRASKKRCSAAFPCSNCVRRGWAERCIASDTEPDPPSIHDSASVQPNVVFPVLPSPPSPSRRHTMASSTVSCPSTGPESIRNTGQIQSHSPDAQHRTHPRLLRSLRGEQVYIGGAASLSFLELIRDMVTQYMGPSSFSDNAKRDTMLETKRGNRVAYLEDPLNVDEKAVLIQMYLIATSGIIHVVSSAEALQMLRDSTSVKAAHDSCHSAVRDLMLAIGAQCETNDETSVEVERFYFLRGQRQAFEDMLENPTLDLVRAFVLLAFYMMGACQRNAASMYLGVAARAATVLGLHTRESQGALRGLERGKRLRVWMSLRVLDLVSSSILGRPNATSMPHFDSHDWMANEIEQTSHIDIFLLASYKVSMIIEDIVGKIYGDKSVSTDTAEALLHRLRQWSDDFRAALLIASVDDTCSQEHGYKLGKLHVACLYYWAVALVTRPFLVSVLTSRLAGTTSPYSIPEDTAYLTLAFSCVDSAVYLLQTCQEIQEAGLLLGSMCLLKAFIFAASLIVGFHMFSGRDASPEVEAAFTSARNILQMLSHRSPQAAHYHEILTLLASVIAEQHKRLSTQAARSRSHYVSRLFNFDPGRPSTAGAVNCGAVEDWMRCTLIDPPTPGVLLGRDSLELPLWDSFPFLVNSYSVEGGLNQ